MLVSSSSVFFNQSSGGGSDLCFFQFLCGSVVFRYLSAVLPDSGSKLLSTEEAKAAIGDVDVVFTALPNGLVFEIAEIAMEKGTKIVDFSADFRLTIRRSTRNGIKRSILRRSSSAGRSTVCRSCGETGSATHSSWPIRMLHDGQHPGRLCSPERRGTGG